MPIIIKTDHPAKQTLWSDNIFVMEETRAASQDIRPLNVLLLNLMPNKLETETQFFRLLANSPLQIQLDLIAPVTHVSKNTSKNHLDKYYNTFDEIKNNHYDAMIITGAPVEKLKFEDVDYWEELKTIFDFTTTNVTSTLFICWASQAALYYFHGINKYPIDKKLSGVYINEKKSNKDPLMRGFDDEFFAPHSRYTEVKKEDIENNPALELLAYSEEAGVHLVSTKDKKQIFIAGHCEYDSDSLDKEYRRDLMAGINPDIPINYYKNNNPNDKIINRWQSHANLLFSNWINYYVYQLTPYDFQ